MNNNNIETLKLLNKIDFLNVSLNEAEPGERIEIIAIRKIKSKYGLRFYMLTTDDVIYQSTPTIFNMLNRLIKNNDLIEHDDTRQIYIYNIVLTPFFCLDIGHVRNNKYKFNSIYPQYIKQRRQTDAEPVQTYINKSN
jgi:hypothetical protein